MKACVSLTDPVALAGLCFLCLGTCSGQHPDNSPPRRGQEAAREHTNMVGNTAGQFAAWFSSLVDSDLSGTIRSAFKNGDVPRNLSSVGELFHFLEVPNATTEGDGEQQGLGVAGQADDPASLFSYIGFPLDPGCTSDRTKWWYRTYDGSCNWFKLNEIHVGEAGTKKSRDYGQHFYADGVSTPRAGPNARAVSNAFFKRHKTLYYEHTPLLMGLIEFLLHDVVYSEDSTTEFVDIPMPPDETEFPPNTTLRVWRTAAETGSGTSEDNPRENLNMATTWMDLSSLYGSSRDVAERLRAFQGGKLLQQNLTTGGYLPFNTMGVPARTRPGVDPAALFAGGDPRTNEDWIMLAVHTLFLREHNRLCDILAARQPGWPDERLYQTARLLTAAKLQMMGNAYQMAYWAPDMPWPRTDGFPLFRAIHGDDFLHINPANTYPWPLVTPAGRPMTISAEMAVVYRFHDFLMPRFPIKDEDNATLWEQDLFDTGFDARGFIDAGLENVLRGVMASTIPNFHSGVDDKFRTAGKYRGRPFDLAAWSVVHEREQGLPTFNRYFEAYNAAGPNVTVPLRGTFESFSSDPAMVASLRRLYPHPDDVDLVVGVQLDEELFPGTTIPKSAAITSLLSLFGTGNSDRFSIGFALMRCWLVDRPWACRPSNALEELLWAPAAGAGAGGGQLRLYDEFWLRELDVQAHGENLLWRLVTENTGIRCLQRRPLFPEDAETNPVVCELPEQKVDVVEVGVTALQVVLALLRQHGWSVAWSGMVGLVGSWFYRWWTQRMG